MEKLKMQSPDLVEKNIAKIGGLFPNCICETKDENGKTNFTVDFDLPKQGLSNSIVEGPREKYSLNWPGKRDSLLHANAPIAKTLRPCMDESLQFDMSNNLFIEGDNLDALKLIQESYLNKVKMIYIDPPYNTGRDFIYDDDYAEAKADYLVRSGQSEESGNRLIANSDANGRFHSDWLSMMHSRLRLARNLLMEDGVLFVSIDDNESPNPRRLCDEVFGERNFVATIVWQKVYSPKNSASWFSEDHDYVLVYARNKSEWRPQQLPRTKEMEARYKNPDDDPRGPWKSENMSARNRYDAGIFPIKCPSGRKLQGPPTGRYWVINEEKFKELDADNRIWWGKDGNNVPAVKSFLSEVSRGRTPQTLWFYDEVGHTQDAKKTLLKYVPFKNTENVLNSVKPIGLIERMLILAGGANEKSIILDFFSGSASTAQAVIEQNMLDGGNRRFIGFQISEPLPKPEPGLASIFEMGLTRIRNVITESVEASPPIKASDNCNSKLGFRVLKVDSSNMKDVYYSPDGVKQDDLFDQIDNIKEDRTPNDLLFQVLLDWGVDLSLPITEETISGKQVFFVDENALAACFEKDIDEAFVKELAARKPLRAVFRDASFTNDSVKINVEQIFKLISPSTDLRSL